MKSETQWLWCATSYQESNWVLEPQFSYVVVIVCYWSNLLTKYRFTNSFHVPSTLFPSRKMYHILTKKRWLTLILQFKILMHKRRKEWMNLLTIIQAIQFCFLGVDLCTWKEKKIKAWCNVYLYENWLLFNKTIMTQVQIKLDVCNCNA